MQIELFESWRFFVHPLVRVFRIVSAMCAKFKKNYADDFRVRVNIFDFFKNDNKFCQHHSRNVM